MSIVVWIECAKGYVVTIYITIGNPDIGMPSSNQPIESIANRAVTD